NRGQRGSRHRQPECGRNRNSATCDQDEQVLDATERMVDLGQRAGNLDCTSRPEGKRQHPKMYSTYVSVAKERATFAPSNSDHVVVDRQRHRSRRASSDVDLPVRVDALRIDRRAPELGDRGPQVFEIVKRGAEHLRRVRLERIVDGGPQLVADDEIDHQRRGQHRESNGGSGDQRETGAKAHGSRSAYPTPRTVWIRRGLPPSSVLRRRYPM